MAQKKKKKVRIRWFRLVALSACTIAALGFALFSTVRLIQNMHYEKIQEERRTYIATVIEKHKEFVDSVNAIQKPEEVDEEFFDKLKDLAVSDDTVDLLDQYNYKEVSSDITDEYFNEVSSLGEFENDASRLLEKIDYIPADYLERLEEDWDRYEFTLAYPDRDLYQNPPETLSVSSLDKVPLVIQWDLDWGYLPYGDLNIALAGCAPTCISMVFSYLLKDASITPAATARLAEEEGMYVLGAGSSHSIFPVLAADYGINCTELGVDRDAINASLQAGHPVILNMVPGDFTKVGHFIVLTGIRDGKYELNDPNSIKRSSQLWDMDTVLSQSANSWSFSV